MEQEVGERLDPCGTLKGYRIHIKERTATCEPCRTASRDYHRQWRKDKGNKRTAVRHVTLLAEPSVKKPGFWIISIFRKPMLGRAAAPSFAEIEKAAGWLVKRIYKDDSRPADINSIIIRYPKAK